MGWDTAIRLTLMSLGTAVLVALSTLPGAAEEKPDCDDQASTYVQQFCADKDFRAADADLNRAYKGALAFIAESNQPKPYDSKSWEAALRAAQRAWIAFREADCKGDVPFGWSGGSGTQTAVLGCMTAHTKARTKDIKERYTPL